MHKKVAAHFVKGIKGTDEILTDGIPQVAFIGRSNVGKSSLINALTHVDGLARVGKKPGKTTEINFLLFRRKSYVVDLPGYGYAQATPKEREKLRNLIVWYFSNSGAKPQMVVLVLDAVAGLTSRDEEMLTVLTGEKHPFIIALNKVDKLKQKELADTITDIKAKVPGAEVFPCSTASGKGLEVLETALFA